MKRTWRVAVLPGDGRGPEVMLLGDSSVAAVLAAMLGALAGDVALLPVAALGDGRVAPNGPAAVDDGAALDAASPVGAIRAAALLLRCTCGASRAADAVEAAVTSALADGGVPGTRAMGERIAAAVAAELKG